MVDECYDYTYSFLKHTTLIHGKFLYLIGMIMLHVKKNVFVHVNMFVVILDRWHIIKNCIGPTALGPKDEKLLVPTGPTLHIVFHHLLMQVGGKKAVFVFHLLLMQVGEKSSVCVCFPIFWVSWLIYSCFLFFFFFFFFGGWGLGTQYFVCFTIFWRSYKIIKLRPI